MDTRYCFVPCGLINRDCFEQSECEFVSSGTVIGVDVALRSRLRGFWMIAVNIFTNRHNAQTRLMFDEREPFFID